MKMWIQLRILPLFRKRRACLVTAKSLMYIKLENLIREKLTLHLDGRLMQTNALCGADTQKWKSDKHCRLIWGYICKRTKPKCIERKWRIM